VAYQCCKTATYEFSRVSGQLLDLIVSRIIDAKLQQYICMKFRKAAFGINWNQNDLGF